MTYADIDDLNEELAPDTAPATAERTLRRAGRIIDEMLIGALYEVDEDDLPIEDFVVLALMEAQVAQCIYMLEVNDETGAKEQWGSISEGDLSLTRNTAKKTARYATEAVEILKVAGLIPVTVDSVGYGSGV